MDKCSGHDYSRSKLLYCRQDHRIDSLEGDLYQEHWCKNPNGTGDEHHEESSDS